VTSEQRRGPIQWTKCYIVAAVKGRKILSYYQGDGYWGSQERAMIEMNLKDAKMLRLAALGVRPENADDTIIVSHLIDV
jgi:hypothetical protein